jgi:isoleucyl-tRNA synthetase
MIWTTTPWTLPANMAIAVNPKFDYSLAWIDGNVTVLAAEAVDRVVKAAKSEQVIELARVRGEALLGLAYRHPFVDPSKGEGVGALNAGQGIEIPAHAKVFRVVGADYVTLEDGTGLVHTAPGHGQEDYMTGLRENVPVYCPVKADGTYDATVPAWLRGKSVWEANRLVTEHLRQSGHLFHDFTFTHSYPHDWRSKTPTIFRCTEQWFVGVDRPFAIAGEQPQHLRHRGLDTTREGVAFVPEWGRNRLRGMLAGTERGQRPCEAVAIDVDGDDVRAGRGQNTRCGPADAGRRTGDDRDATREAERAEGEIVHHRSINPPSTSSVCPVT